MPGFTFVDISTTGIRKRTTTMSRRTRPGIRRTGQSKDVYEEKDSNKDDNNEEDENESWQIRKKQRKRINSRTMTQNEKYEDKG